MISIMDEPPLIIPPAKDNRDASEVQADRFLGSLIFGIILITALFLIVSGIFIQKSGVLISAGISVSIADLAALIVWRAHAPAFVSFWPRIYFFVTGISALLIYWSIGSFFGTN